MQYRTFILFHKMLVIFQPAEELSASQEELCSMELVDLFKRTSKLKKKIFVGFAVNPVLSQNLATSRKFLWYHRTYDRIVRVCRSAFALVQLQHLFREIVPASLLLCTDCSRSIVIEQNVFEFRCQDIRSCNNGSRTIGIQPLLYPTQHYLASQHYNVASFLQSFRVSEPISNLIKQMKRPARVRCSAFLRPCLFPPPSYKCSPLFRNITSSATLSPTVFRLLISIQCDDIVCIILRERIVTLLSVRPYVRTSLHQD